MVRYELNNVFFFYHNQTSHYYKLALVYGLNQKYSNNINYNSYNEIAKNIYWTRKSNRRIPNFKYIRIKEKADSMSLQKI